MVKRVYPTCWQQWIGKTAIIIRFDEPHVVYVKGLHKNFCSLIVEGINTNEISWCGPLHLIPYSRSMYQKLKKIGEYKNAKKRLTEARSKIVKEVVSNG